MAPLSTVDLRQESSSPSSLVLYFSIALLLLILQIRLERFKVLEAVLDTCSNLLSRVWFFEISSFQLCFLDSRLSELLPHRVLLARELLFPDQLPPSSFSNSSLSLSRFLSPKVIYSLPEFPRTQASRYPRRSARYLALLISPLS